MFHSIGTKTNLRQIFKCGVILTLLLPSASLFAQAPAKDGLLANPQAASAQTVTTRKSVTRSGSTFRRASTVDLSQTKKVHKDDFGRLLQTVTQPRSTQMIWLGQQNRAGKPRTPRTTWLGRKSRSD